MTDADANHPIDLAELDTATEGDHELREELIGEYLLDCESRLATLRTALSEDNPVSIRNEAHAIKGGSGAVAAGGMVAIAQELEGMAESGDVAGCEGLVARLGEEFARVKEFCEAR